MKGRLFCGRRWWWSDYEPVGMTGDEFFLAESAEGQRTFLTSVINYSIPGSSSLSEAVSASWWLCHFPCQTASLEANPVQAAAPSASRWLRLRSATILSQKVAERSRSPATHLDQITTTARTFQLIRPFTYFHPSKKKHLNQYYYESTTSLLRCPETRSQSHY
jgi:hypothetical protein